jgi:pimeloyl-ACP methyl ester carboxylesterase
MGQTALPYDHTAFLNGIASSKGIWLQSYSDLGAAPAGYLSTQIDLKLVDYFEVDSSKTYNEQVGMISSDLGVGGQYVLVGHSLGSLVARGTYIDSVAKRPQIAAIIAIAAPHQGAPIAVNMPDLKRFMADFQRRINDGISACNAEAPIWAFLSMSLPFSHGLGPALVFFILKKVNDGVLDLSNLVGAPDPPALPDLSPASAAILHLNQRTDDASIPRANIYGTIPFRDAALRMYSSSINDDAGFDGLVTKRNLGVVVFTACKYIGYASIIEWGSGRRCAYAKIVLGRLDDRWAKYYNGTDQNGNGAKIPFDGVVPNANQVYPSPGAINYNANVPVANHINIYKVRRGLDQVANAMHSVGMQDAGGGPPPGGITAVSATGPSRINGCTGATWTANTTGGVPPITYHWTVESASENTGTDNHLMYTNSGEVPSIFVRATATDANGSSFTSSPFKTNITIPGAC